jgi:ribosomal protein S18 acetylase RimI-like enzyme
MPGVATPGVETPGVATLSAEPVSAADAEVLLDLARVFNREDGHPLDAAAEAAMRHVAHGEPLAPAYFLKHERTIIGYFVLSLGYSPEHGGKDGFIDDIYIAPEWRGRGLGRAALDLAVDAARHHGARVLLLEVEPDNQRAYRLYETSGFYDTKRRLMRRYL